MKNATLEKMIQTTPRHLIKKRLSGGFQRAKSAWRVKAGRREILRLGEHMLQDLGFDDEGNLLTPAKTEIHVGDGRGCRGLPSGRPLGWCDCECAG